MSNRSSLLHAIFALISLGFVLAAAHQAASAQSGVQVVKNPKKPVAVAGQPSSLTLKQDLVIGLTGGAEGDLFAELRSVGVDDQENIWTLDWEDIKVRIFDKTGKPLITFGKKGQGPKELQNPGRMIVSGRRDRGDHGPQQARLLRPERPVPERAIAGTDELVPDEVRPQGIHLPRLLGLRAGSGDENGEADLEDHEIRRRPEAPQSLPHRTRSPRRWVR